MWFSDEANFHLNGCVNKQNINVWASDHLHNIMETYLQPEKCSVWCFLSSGGIVGPVFFDDTVIADHYLHVFHLFREWVS
jgi:hypothetical protein